ncbi:lipopolysaccharide biosynthesis protein [Priestia aryabhattai]|uniref:lipopolysaccharide biosynthesis protein n=1 Tax=Priestia aryabhattai TaxID=412384 RepID=UPI0023791770|nr:lipopolysaccharide biosynthesis protein [Priestia aryabhattai]WDL88475.1 lipopolysaccharide biosynthesis protein [Priestia aryabhattai]
MKQTHKTKTLKGMKWNFTSVFAQSLVSLLLLVILARIVPPREFGILTLSTIFVGFAEKFATLGVGPYIVQRKNLTREHIRVCLSLSIISGIVMYISLYILAPYIAGFFNESRLVLILRIASLQFFLLGISNVSRSLLMRELNFKTIFRIEFPAYIIGQGGITIILALLGYGAWSLVLGSLLTVSLTTIFLLVRVKPPLKPLLNKEYIKDISWYGGGVSAIGIINYFANSVDNFLIGRYLNITEVGLYNRSVQLMKLPLSKISGTMSNVLFSSYSGIQNDLKSLEEAYLKSVSIVSFISFPLLTGMAIGGDYIILGLYGEEWKKAVVVFQILCFAGIFKVIFNLAGPIAKATGNVYKEAIRQALYLVIVIISTWIGVHMGAEGVAIAVIISSSCFYLSMAQLSIKILGSSWKKFIGAQIHAFLFTIVFGVSCVVFKIILNSVFIDISFLFKLIAFLMLCGIAYILLSLFLPIKIKGNIPVIFFSKIKKRSSPTINKIIFRNF